MKKILLWTVGLIILLLTSALVTPFLFKDKILNEVKKAANENLNARINFSNDIELSLFKHFPDFTLGISDVEVIGINEFENDTLLSLTKFGTTIDIMSVIKGDKMKIKRIVLTQPRINAIILANGKANWDIAKTSADTTQETPSDTSASAFNIALKYFAIENAYISYNDKKGNTSAKIENFSHELVGDFTQDLVLLNTKNLIEKMSVAQSGITYLNNVRFELNADIEANLKDKIYTLKENVIKLNRLVFSIVGFVSQSGDNLGIDIKFNASQAEFKDFISLIPGMYTKDFEKVQTKGKLSFNAEAKGTYNDKSLPAFRFELAVSDASVKYPDLPSQINNIQIDLKVNNPDGIPNNTEVNLNMFHFELGSDPFNAKMIANNLIIDPHIDATFNGSIDIAALSKAVPLDDMNMSGSFKMDIVLKGNSSYIEKKQYEKFDARGQFEMNDFKLLRKENPQQITVAKAFVTVTPKALSLKQLDVFVGKSDFRLNGEVSNFIPYVLKGETLVGTLNLNSSLIDANEFLSPSEETANKQPTSTTDTAKINAPEIPSNIDFTFNSAIGKINYTNMDIENFKGQVVVRNQKLSFNNVGLNTLGAFLGLDGFYTSADRKHPSAEINFNIKNLDIKKAATTFNTVKKLAPIAEKMTGTFSASFFFNGTFDNHMNVDYNTVFAKGILDIPNATIKDVKVFNKAAGLLKYDKLRDPGINNVKIKFTVENGKITTEPFDMNIAGQKLTLSGSTGLDQTIDYTGLMRIPKSSLGVANNAVNQALDALNKKAGTSVRSTGDVNVKLLIGGTFTDPKISTNLADIAKDEANSLADQLKAEADRKRKELEDKAKQELDKAKAEAEAKARAEADRIKKEAEDKVKAEQERLKKEAEAKAKAEEERLKKQAEEEAKKRLKGIFKP
jgi:uncharacterized protein involved in outer membrane biogenesis